MSVEAGGTAFPVPDSKYQFQDRGMTLRDYFAAKALASIPLSLDSREQALIADAAYRQADAMLSARGQ